MFPEYEIPEMSDFPEKDTEVESTSVEEKTSPESQSQEPASEEKPQEEKAESKASSEVRDTPSNGRALEVTAHIAALVAGRQTSASSPATPSPKAEKAKTEKKESSKEEKKKPEAEPIPEGIEEGLWNRMKEILSGDKSNQQILSEAKLQDLLILLDHFIQDEKILRHIPRVGLIKRTFDALKYSEEIPQEQIDLFQDKLAAFNKNRVEAQKVVEEQKKENAEKKAELLKRLKEVVDTQDPLKIKEVRAIQDEWKSIGQVPRDQMDNLYREYRALLDDFYKRRELHFEMLDYDRKKNLQDKEKLIEEAKNLIPPEEEREDNEVWKQKMDDLNELQQQWKSVGHVPREDMERINNDYRSIIDQFFELRSIFLGKLDEERGENAEKKEEILAEMAHFAEFDAEKPRQWNEATKELKAFQEKWKEIGQAAYSVNNELWNRYRAICDAFFSRKAEFFKKFDEFRAENLIKKRELCERAEELAASEQWEKSAKELKQLQKDWKTIGPVPERHSNKLWSRFRAACDKFFEGRRAHYQKMHEGEYANLDAKKELIEEVKKLTEEQNQNIEEAIERVKTIQKEWKAVGKVPYKEKDKIWEVFRKQVDAFFNGLSAKRSRMRDMALNTKLEEIDDDKQRSNAIKERVRRIRRKISQSQEKVDQYSTNIQFISKGKSGDKLRNQIQGQIDEEKKLIKEWKNKIKELNEMAKNPPKNEDEKPKVEGEVEQPPAPDTSSEEQQAKQNEEAVAAVETAKNVKKAAETEGDEPSARDQDAEGGDEG